ncbi:MAG TPA: family 16 glycoside hydrolase, partial [Gemmataceae bacterium]|nr:family 16 glycoside hydrolase [Gemmataceae bacterium]
NGNHLAVWVNGYQTADFTDTRAPNKSARKGSKVEKGPISLQGHDPTTDLSFRNIRIAELPKR